jgi:hypothetical protein
VNENRLPKAVIQAASQELRQLVTGRINTAIAEFFEANDDLPFAPLEDAATVRALAQRIEEFAPAMLGEVVGFVLAAEVDAQGNAVEAARAVDYFNTVQGDWKLDMVRQPQMLSEDEPAAPGPRSSALKQAQALQMFIKHSSVLERMAQRQDEDESALPADLESAIDELVGRLEAEAVKPPLLSAHLQGVRDALRAAYDIRLQILDAPPDSRLRKPYMQLHLNTIIEALADIVEPDETD